MATLAPPVPTPMIQSISDVRLSIQFGPIFQYLSVSLYEVCISLRRGLAIAANWFSDRYINSLMRQGIFPELVNGEKDQKFTLTLFMDL